jgi:anti-sigma factor ChrR (cupin superfamily)
MINMNFDQRVIINTNECSWVITSNRGIWRKKLERESAKGGHVTSVVRYNPGTFFATHCHPNGEEILVLEGTFSDESGDYTKGMYIRNPPGSKHTPFSKEGCVLFVKLNQFSRYDTKQLRIDTTNAKWLPGHGNLQVMPLHEIGGEHVALVKWPPGERFHPHLHYGGEEIYVVSGEFNDEHGTYPAGTWIRNPHMSLHNPYVIVETVILVKVGHLPKLRVIK